MRANEEKNMTDKKITKHGWLKLEEAAKMLGRKERYVHELTVKRRVIPVEYAGPVVHVNELARYQAGLKRKRAPREDLQEGLTLEEYLAAGFPERVLELDVLALADDALAAAQKGTPCPLQILAGAVRAKIRGERGK